MENSLLYKTIQKINKYTRKRKFKSIETLLSKIENINVQDEYGNTILHYISPLLFYKPYTSYFNLIKILIDKGANPCIENKEHEIPIIRMLKDLCHWYTNQRLHEYQEDHFKYIIEHSNIDINRKYNIKCWNTPKGSTLLHIIFRNTYIKYDRLINYLISKGARVDITDDNGHIVLEDFERLYF